MFHTPPGRKEFGLWNVSTMCPIFPLGRGGDASARRKGPDLVLLSDVTELRVLKGQTELLDKCHRHHADIGAVFFMLPLCLLRCGARVQLWQRSC